MRKLLAAALIAVPFQPVLAAGMCLHTSARHAEHCEMPAGESPSTPAQTPPSNPADCIGLALCAPSGPVIPGTAMELADPWLSAGTDYLAPPLLRLGDPADPLDPPPIA